MAFLPLGELAVLSGSPDACTFRVDHDQPHHAPDRRHGPQDRGPGTERDRASPGFDRTRRNSQSTSCLSTCAAMIWAEWRCPARLRLRICSTLKNIHMFFTSFRTVVATKEKSADAWDVVCATLSSGNGHRSAQDPFNGNYRNAREIAAGDLRSRVFGVIGFGGFVNLGLSSAHDRRASRRLRGAEHPAGIVVDSSAESEWLETRAKMGSTIRA